MSRKQLFLGFGLLLLMVLTAITMTIANLRRTSSTGETISQSSSLPAATESGYVAVPLNPSTVPVVSPRPAASLKVSPKPSVVVTPSPSPAPSVDYYAQIDQCIPNAREHDGSHPVYSDEYLAAAADGSGFCRS